MLDFTNCRIKNIIVHQVGNKTNGEFLNLSASLLDTSDERLSDLLLKYFLSPFTNVEYHCFTFSNGDFKMNPIFNYTCSIFDGIESFQKSSIDVAKHLYETSIHPQVKSGDLFVVSFTNIRIDNDETDAVGIFKSENRQSFLKLDNINNDFLLKYDDGISVDKLDKGCLIFNIEKEKGFKAAIIDKANKAAEAQFWKESFLNLKPCSDDYHFTKEFLNITKNFVTKQISEEFEISKTDKIELLNRSVEYFKNHETFDKTDFEQEVFKDNGLIKSFQNFDSNYREENEIELLENFEISPQAVKKQAKIFKSVLKLDKNFHIYIHGNRGLIEQGVENDGRKYYKIYYKDES